MWNSSKSPLWKALYLVWQCVFAQSIFGVPFSELPSQAWIRLWNVLSDRSRYVLAEGGAFTQEKMLSHSGGACVWGGSVSVVIVEQVWTLEWVVSGSVPLSSSYELGQAAQRLRAPNSLCSKWKKSHLPRGVVMKIKCINVCRVLVPGKHSKSVNTLLDYTVLLTHFVSSQMKLLCSSAFKPFLSLLMFFPIPPPTYISPSCISVCPNPVSL